MNHRPTCSQCRSEDLESAGGPIRDSGKLIYPRRCRQCGFFWSADKPLTLPPPVRKHDEPAPVVGPEPVDVPVPVTEPPPAAPAPEVPLAAAPAAEPEPKAAGAGRRRKVKW